MTTIKVPRGMMRQMERLARQAAGYATLSLTLRRHGSGPIVGQYTAYSERPRGLKHGVSAAAVVDAIVNDESAPAESADLSVVNVDAEVLL